MDDNNIKYKILKLNDLGDTFLKYFNRYQETDYVLFNDNDKYIIKKDHYIEKWDDTKKKNIIQSLSNCIKKGGNVISVFYNNILIGFAAIENDFFGDNKEYIELSYIHISNEYRNKGIGKKLFELCCIKAREMNAKILYIGTNPSIETQNFYKSVGCIFSKYINENIYNNEPLDIQLEYILE